MANLRRRALQAGSHYGDCIGDSGCYWADLDAQYKRAEAELTNKLAAKKPATGSPASLLAG